MIASPNYFLTSDVVTMKKKGTGYNFPFDLQELNDARIKDVYLFPRDHECVLRLGKAYCFVGVNFASSFLQIPLKYEDDSKTNLNM